MKRRKTGIIILLTLSFIFLAMPAEVTGASDPPKLPHAFSGDLTIVGNGKEVPAPRGTLVTARVEEVVKGELSTVQTGKYGDVENIEIDDLTVSDGLESGEVIRFYVNGIDTGQAREFDSGADTILDLTVRDDEPPSVTIDPVNTPTNNDTQTIIGSYHDVFIDNITVNGNVAELVKTSVDSGTYSGTVDLESGSNTVTVTATDNVGNENTVETTITFDETPPTISNISVTNITSSAATVSWTTNEPATSVVDYGPTTDRDSRESDTALTTDHSIRLTGLSADTTYHYRVASRDEAGNQNRTSDRTFTTSTAPTPNEPPTADADGPYSVDEGKSVQLDGTGSSDDDGNIASYSWEITSGPGSLQNADSSEPTYVAPDDVDSDTDVTVELTVTDDDGATDTATATVTVRNVPAPNEPPIADAGGPYSVDEGSSVSLDGTGSYDPDGSIESYSWSIESDPTGDASLSDSDTSSPAFHAPIVDTDTTVSVKLTVTDDNGATDTVTSTVAVEALPPAPSPAKIENMTPENAAENLSRSDPESAAESLENVSPEKAGQIIDSAVEGGLTENISNVVSRMGTSKAATARHEADPSSAARVTESIARKDPTRAARIVESGVKTNPEKEAAIINETDTETAATLIVEIAKLPETPQAAATLLEHMSLDKSAAVMETLIKRGEFEYIDKILAKMSDEPLNGTYSELSVKQRGKLYPKLSQSVRDRIAEDLAPRFKTSDLSVSKREAKPGETTTISAEVTNTGGTPDTYKVELLVNGERVNSRDVELKPNQSETVSFDVTREEVGTYSVRMNGLTGNFKVKKPPKPFPWTAVAAIIVIIIVVIAGVWYWYRQKETSESGGL